MGRNQLGIDNRFFDNHTVHSNETLIKKSTPPIEKPKTVSPETSVGEISENTDLKLKKVSHHNSSPITPLVSTSIAKGLAGQKSATSSGSDEKILVQATADFQSRMQDLSHQSPEKFTAILRQIYGDKMTDEKAKELLNLAKEGKFPVPEIRLVDEQQLNGAKGAYSSAGEGCIYLSRSLTQDLKQLQEVLSEEIGHHLDKALGGDTVGDEGQMFRESIAKGDTLTDEEMAVAKRDLDKGTITIDGKEIEVEFFLPALAVAWVANLAVNVAIDTVIDLGIGALLGEAITATGATKSILLNTAMDALPGVGPAANKVKKATVLARALDKIHDSFKVLQNLQTPQAKAILTKYQNAKNTLNQLVEALKKGDFSGLTVSKIKDAFKQLMDAVNEARPLMKQAEKEAKSRKPSGVSGVDKKPEIGSGKVKLRQEPQIKPYSTQSLNQNGIHRIDKIDTSVGSQTHAHLLDGKGNKIAVDVFGEAHHGQSAGQAIPKKTADYLRSLGFQIPKDNIIKPRS